jgi:hypothetical protein
VRTGAKSEWIIHTLIAAAITAAGGYLAYRYFKKKGLVKIPNVGVCEHCREPLTGAKFVPDNDTPYIVCKKCCKENYAKYLSGVNLEIQNMTIPLTPPPRDSNLQQSNPGKRSNSLGQRGFVEVCRRWKFLSPSGT